MSSRIFPSREVKPKTKKQKKMLAEEDDLLDSNESLDLNFLIEEEEPPKKTYSFEIPPLPQQVPPKKKTIPKKEKNVPKTMAIPTLNASVYRKTVAIPRYLEKRQRRIWDHSHTVHPSRSNCAKMRARHGGKFLSYTYRFVPVA
jgi:hypothetical protein